METDTLTTGIDAVPGTAGNDTINGNGSTLTTLDLIIGGAGTDTLSIVDTAGALGTAPSHVSLSSIEVVSISTTGDLGVAAGGVTAAAQINKYVMPTSAANTAQVNKYTFDTPNAATNTVQFTFGGSAGSYVTGANGNTAAVAFTASLNTVAGTTIAAVPAAKVAANTDAATDKILVFTDAVAVGIEVGDVVTGANITALITVASISSTGGSTTVTLTAGATFASTASNYTFSKSYAVVTSPVSGQPTSSIAFTAATDVTGYPVQALSTANVDGNVGDLVSITVGSNTGTFAIGATKAATADNMVAAINTLAGATIADEGTFTGNSFATGASGEEVAVIAPIAGTQLPSISFSGPVANLPVGGAVVNNSLNTAVNAAAYDMSTMTADAVNVVMADSSNLKAASTSDVNVSGVTGAIVVDGGKNINVTDASAASDITIGATTVPKGSVIVNATKAGASTVAVDGGTDVTVNVTGSSGGADSITVGNGGATTDLPSGAVVINQAHTATAATDVTLNTVNVKGGSSVVITNTADSSKAAADTTGATLTQGAIDVTGGATTTNMTVNQAAAATENVAVAAVAAVATTQKVTFAAAASGDVITATFGTNKTLAFKAAKALTATEVASAFANLAKDATTGSNAAPLGSYTNGTAAINTGWISGAVTTSTDAATASVTFSNASTTATITSVGTSGSGTAPVLASVAAGTAAVLAETGVLGVTAGAVTVNGAITGADVLTTVTLNSYGTSTVASDALTTLNLSNAATGLIVTSASTGSITLNLNKVAGASAAVSLDGGTATVTGVTINATGTKSDLAVTAVVATAVTVNAAVDLDLTGSALDKAAKITVTGAGNVILDGDASTSVLAAIDASAATGNVNASAVALTAAGVYTGGSGVDTFTVTASATKASTGGAGDDVITVSSFSTGGSVDAGAGTDTLVMAAADAATADANTVFSTKATNFERLTISTANTAATTLDLANLGLTTYVTTSGTGQTVFSDASAYLATNKIVLAINGTAVTTVVPTLTGTGDDADVTAAINAAANTALSTTSVVYVAAALTTTNKVLTVSAASGAYTVSGISMTDTSDVSLASAVADTALVLDNLSSGATVVLTKDGTITAQVKDASTGTADIITVAISQDGSLDAGSFTAANVETVNITADDKIVDVTGAKDEFGADIADGKDDTNSVQALALTADKAATLNVTGSADLTLDLVSSAAVTVVNASTMTGNLTLVADGKSTGTTVTGGAGNDVLTASGSGDVLIGGAGNDTLTAADLSTLTGGAGNDTFAFAAVDATLYSTITDLSAGDVVDLATGSGFTSTKVSLASAATFAQYLDAAIVAAAAGVTTIGAAWFQFNGDTFLVAEAVTGSGNTYGSGDAVIAITGLVDLSKATFNATTGDLTIA